MKDGNLYCAQEAIEEGKESGRNVSKEETVAIQCRRATIILFIQ